MLSATNNDEIMYPADPLVEAAAAAGERMRRLQGETGDCRGRGEGLHADTISGCQVLRLSRTSLLKNDLCSGSSCATSTAGPAGSAARPAPSSARSSGSATGPGRSSAAILSQSRRLATASQDAE